MLTIKYSKDNNSSEDREHSSETNFEQEINIWAYL